MLFDSLTFAVYLPLVLILFISFSQYRKYTLLIASYVFYGWWDWYYLPLLMFSTFMAYFCAMKIEENDKKSLKKKYLLLGIGSNLILLSFFKYFNFINAQFDTILTSLGFNYLVPYSSLLLPMGISFFVFQAIGYLIDVYRSDIKAENNIVDFALFVSFFPQLVAGPIERAGNLIEQLKSKLSFSEENFVYGLGRLLWGLVKKIVISNLLAVFVNQVYNGPSEYDGVVIVIATVFFAFQIYCDFSGYSDMAIGLARMFGIRLMENFESPYFSKNIREFWTRWHISLSTWFKDYLYIPLGGNRKRVYTNLFIVFVVSGLWHGANWNFVIWGALHGVLLIGTNFLLKRTPLFSNWNFSVLSGLFTFSFVCFAWIFFRSNDWESTKILLSNLLTFEPIYIKDLLYQIKLGLFHPSKLGEPLNLDFGRINFQLSIGGFILSGVFIVLLVLIEAFGKRLVLDFGVEKNSTYLKLVVFSFLILFFGVFSSNQFIYFQF